jgi:hypothetical protein
VSALLASSPSIHPCTTTFCLSRRHFRFHPNYAASRSFSRIPRFFALFIVAPAQIICLLMDHNASANNAVHAFQSDQKVPDLHIGGTILLQILEYLNTQ